MAHQHVDRRAMRATTVMELARASQRRHQELPLPRLRSPSLPLDIAVGSLRRGGHCGTPGRWLLVADGPLLLVDGTTRVR